MGISEKCCTSQYNVEDTYADRLARNNALSCGCFYFEFCFAGRWHRLRMGQWSNRLDTYHTGCLLGGPRLLGSQLDFEGF